MRVNVGCCKARPEPERCSRPGKVDMNKPSEAKPLDEETSSYVDELARELATDPPLKCPVTFHWSGNEELANQVNIQLQVHAILMRRRHPWLTFDALDSIVFHYDYQQALKDVSEKAGRPCEATSEVSGIGVAMTVHLDKKCVLVIDAGVALGLVTADDQAHKDLCIDLVLHELCHVHDYSRKSNLLAHEFLKRKLQGLEFHTFTAADAAWNEYFANRYCTSAASSPDMYPKYLADVVPDVLNDVKAAIRAYRTHHLLDAVVATSNQKVRFLFQCFGYAAGRLLANEVSLADIALESEEALSNAGLIGVWKSVLSELQRLDESRDKWASFDEFKPLMQLVLDTYTVLGMHFRESEGQVMVDIPYTPDTLPFIST